MRDSNVRSKSIWQFLFLALIVIGSSGCRNSATQKTANSATYQPITSPEILDTLSTQVVTVQPSFTAEPRSSTTPLFMPTYNVERVPLFGTATLKPGFQFSPTPKTITQGDTTEILTQVARSRVVADLQRFTGKEPICAENGCHIINHRLTGSEGLRWVKAYIYSELVNLGYSVEIQDWAHSGYADQNVIAKKPGITTPNEEIYFVAHLDGVNGGAIDQYPAADDNASGVIDILEMARVLSSGSFQRTFVLLFTTGEEQGTLGVRAYIDHLSQQELSFIKYVVDVDMVGYDANRDGKMELWYGGHSPSLALAQIMSDIILSNQIDLAPGFVIGCG
jgi:hypothetical protein